MLRDMTTCKVVKAIIVMFKKIIKTLNSIYCFNYSSKWRWNAYQLSLPHTCIVQNLTKQTFFFFASKQYHIVTHLVWVHDKRIDTWLWIFPQFVSIKGKITWLLEKIKEIIVLKNTNTSYTSLNITALDCRSKLLGQSSVVGKFSSNASPLVGMTRYLRNCWK